MRQTQIRFQKKDGEKFLVLELEFPVLTVVDVLSRQVKHKIFEDAAPPDEMHLTIRDQDFGRGCVAEKSERAGGSGIGSRLEYSNTISNGCWR